MQRGILVLKLEPLIRAKAKENQSMAGGDRINNKPLCLNSDEAVKPVDTMKELADIANNPPSGACGEA